VSRHFERRSKQKSLITTILIVCGGKETEVNYFRKFPVDTKIVHVNITGRGKDPDRLVEHAIREKQSAKGSTYNQIWCVFDKDEFKEENFDNAIKKAKHAKIKVAYSNQCFELWYCLHFCFINSALHRDQYYAKLENELGTYKKNDSDIYHQIVKNQQQAINFAKKLYKNSAQLPPSQQDPVTLVYRLVNELNKFI
jgi:hypothetical protein